MKNNSLPIAYSLQRRAKKVLNNKLALEKADKKNSESPDDTIPTYSSPAMAEFMSGKAKQLAEGGMINHEEPFKKAQADDVPFSEGQDDVGEHYASIADAILSKKRAAAKKMADGGMVDLEENSEEADADHAASFNQAANLKEQYDDEQLDEDPLDSNEIGDEDEKDEENENDEDVVGSIRKRMKSKRA